MSSKKNSNGKSIAVWRWFLLLLVAWPGPRPMVHTHDQLARWAASSDVSRHLVQFHSTDSNNLPPWKLHFHWSYGDCALSDERGVSASSGTMSSAEQLSCLAADVGDWVRETSSDHLANQTGLSRLSIDKRDTAPANRLWLQLSGTWNC